MLSLFSLGSTDTNNHLMILSTFIEKGTVM